MKENEKEIKLSKASDLASASTFIQSKASHASLPEGLNSFGTRNFRSDPHTADSHVTVTNSKEVNQNPGSTVHVYGNRMFGKVFRDSVDKSFQ